MTVRIGQVVEGHGEVEALPVLVRRLGLETSDPIVVEIPPPVRVPRSKLLKAGELENAVVLAASKAGDGAGVIVLIDADDDCPADLGPRLLVRARRVAADRFPVAVVLARSEYESWFIAGAVSLQGHRGLRDDLAPPVDVEAIRDAKGWLSDHMVPDAAYSEVLDQPALTAEVDIGAARAASDSFDKFCRDVLALIAFLKRTDEE